MEGDAVRPRHRQGEDDTVGQRNGGGQGPGLQTLPPDGGQVDSVALLPEKPGQGPVAQVPAHQPEVAFLLEWLQGITFFPVILWQRTSGGAGLFPEGSISRLRSPRRCGILGK